MAKIPAIRGKHVSLTITAEGTGKVDIYTINSFNDSEDAELDSKGYLGERSKTSSREHNGWEGDFDFDISNGKAMDLEESIIARERDSLNPLNVSITKVLFFRDGSTKKITYPKIALKLKFSAPNREGYVHGSATWRGDSRTVSD